MIWGIEGRHAWTPPGADEPAIVLGRELDDAGVRVWPHLKLDRISGLHSLGDSEDRRDPRIGQIGEITRHSKRRGKTVTYEGRIRARSLKTLREAEADLRAAFAEQEAEGRMDVTPHPLNTEFAGEPAKFFTARALGIDIIDRQEQRGYTRFFVLALRLGDPRYFDDETETFNRVTVKTNTRYEWE